MRKLQNRPENGFTIIELLIVLAIAALIILIVLIAVPQLQRNQRNTARQNIAGRIATEINNFAGNNNGNLPAEGDDADDGFTGGFRDRYFDGVDIQDPQRDISLLDDSNVSFSADGLESADEAGNLYYEEEAICEGEVVQEGNARNFALVVRLEGGAGYCLDNS